MRQNLAGGLWTDRRHRLPSPHQPHRRRECLGELVQIDGSEHAWLEDRGGMCTLRTFVDDATSQLMQLGFVTSESAFDYFRTTRAYLEQHGKPVAFYSDKHGIFRMNNKDAVGGDVVTQFGRALVALLLSTQDTVGRATTDSHRGVVTAKAVRRERPVACSIGMKSRSMPPPHVAAEIPVVDPPRNSAKNTKSEQPRVSQSL